MSSDLVLTDRERVRLAKVKQMLKDGISPYANLSTLVIGDTRGLVKPTVELTPRQRITKFNNTRPNSHKWSYLLDTDEVPNAVTGPTCINCKKAIQIVSSVYGRIIANLMTAVIDATRIINGVTVECRKVISYPVFETGYACRPCFDTLYADKYYDVEGNLHRGITLLEPGVTKIKETNASGGIHSVPLVQSMGTTIGRGRDKVHVTDVLLGKGGEVEEWAPIRPLPKVEPEPVDPIAYRCVFPARRKVGKK